jgi:membrane protease YdiL (CAAX protease family)
VSDNLARNRLIAIAALGVLLYAAAEHFATFAYGVVPLVDLLSLKTWQIRLETVLWVTDLLALAFLCGAYRVLPDEFRPDIGVRPCSAWWYVGAAMLGIVVTLLNSTIIWGLSLAGIHGTTVFTDFQHPSAFVAYTLVLEVGVVSPIVQEIVFRGWLLSGLRRVLPLTPVIVASALVFSLMHLRSGIPTLAHAFVFGLVAAALFVRSRSIIPPVILHMVVNSVGGFLWMYKTLQ